MMGDAWWDRPDLQRTTGGTWWDEPASDGWRRRLAVEGGSGGLLAEVVAIVRESEI
jgi:hypothetical protein